MKNCLALVAVLAMVVAAPALAGDGNVSRSTLKSLGLSSMSVVSDVEGLKVRGMSSNAQATSLSAYSVFLYDPNTGSTANFNGSGYGRATAENAGLNPVSTADVASLTQQTATDIVILHNGASFHATFSAFGINGAGWAFAY